MLRRVTASRHWDACHGPRAARVFAALLTTPPPGLDPDQRSIRDLSRAIVRRGPYASQRTLSDYDFHFGGELLASVCKLRPGDHWIDAGGGAGVALQNYRVNGGRAQCTLVTHELPDVAHAQLLRWPAMRVHVGFVEEISDADITGGQPARLITDHRGLVMYSDRPAEMLNRELAMLEPDGGELWLHVGRRTGHNQTVLRGSGRLAFLDWLYEPPRGVTIEPRGGGHLLRVTDPTAVSYAGLILTKIEKVRGGYEFPPYHRTFEQAEAAGDRPPLGRHRAGRKR